MKRLLAVGLLLAGLALVHPKHGDARYEYARQVGKRCSACHVGGRPDVTNLKPAGLHFMARGTLEGIAADAKARTGRPADASQGAGRSPGSVSPASAARPSAAGAGAALFEQNCAPCHGARGAGTDKAKSLVPPERARSAAEVETVIRGGIAGTTMFAFGEVLSAAEIETLARHVEELRRP
jgi:mono/diheme cytochrome c family protein